MARVILFTAQIEAMSRFYGTVLGLKQISDEKGWKEFSAGGVTIALHSGPSSPGRKGPKIVFYAKDVGAIVVGSRIPADDFHSYIRGFGFGRLTGIDLPGESPGLVRAPRMRFGSRRTGNSSRSATAPEKSSSGTSPALSTPSSISTATG